MAEEESDLDSERLKEELESLLDNGGKGGNGLQSKLYCTRFCQVVEEHTGRCQVPLPQLQVLRTALCCFTQGIATFPADCEHVQYTLSSLALSFFELLLFFGKDEFLEDPLKDILDSFQECHSCLLGHGNMYLMLVKQIVKEGGPWENPVLQAILKEMPQHQEEVDRYLSSEVPAFFEFRVRYLLACERIQEAVALSKCCIQHSEVGRHLYFHQAYLTCLLKASLYDHLQKEMAMIDGKDAVEIICNTENEEKDDLLLVLCKAFLTQQLQNGDMYYIWDLIFIWSKLQLRANPSKQDFLEECHQLMSTATNVKMIFPFMKIIKAELGEEGLQFCVELCACALQMDLRHDPVTKSLVYKMIAYLLPNDLEVCRACALLVFFMERTVDSYKIVYLLYTYPDQEYHMDSSVIKNHIRFELLQILKRGLFFDPEFWNLITLKTNCLSLMSEKVMKAALNETVEDDKWIQNDSIKETYKMHSEIPDKHTSQLMNYSDKDRLPCQSARNENCVPRHRCMLCNKDFMGGHIKRHALVHLQKGNLRCVLCGKTYKQRNFMLNHLKEHLQKMKSKKRLPDTQSNENCTPVENGTSETCERDVISLPPDLKHSAAEVENHVENHNRINVNLEHVSSESQGLLKSDKNEIACAAKDQSMVQRANGSISKQKSECQKEQFRCPAEGCARSFVRQWVLVKHVKKAHPNDMKVQECTFLWTKGKCQYCQRKFLCLQHYSDHLKRHDGAHRYFCQHYSCNERFKTQAELGQHLKTHSQFQAQCSFPECFELFSDLSLLHEHECWHYSLMTNLDGTPSAAASGHNSTEASGILVKRKRKKDAQEAPIQDLKVRKESAQPKTYIPSGGGKSILNSVEVKVATPEAKSLEQPEDGAREDSAGGRVSDGQLLNGHADGDKPASAQLPEGAAQALDLQDHAPEAGKKDTGPTEIKSEGVAGKDPEKAPPPQDVSTAALKKPRRYDDEVYSYGGTSKKPFIRPPPSAYLAEQYISMPKRRKSPTKAESPSSAPQSEQAGGVQRHRCTKCFALFDKAEELQSHLAQKKCQAFFGFDSDEESKWW
uniref:Zinc finger protein 654 n=1 Tax=Lepisosteus oculatus TaxID=7918 RepID=W5MWX8_LEPOC